MLWGKGRETRALSLCQSQEHICLHMSNPLTATVVHSPFNSVWLEGNDTVVTVFISSQQGRTYNSTRGGQQVNTAALWPVNITAENFSPTLTRMLILLF